MRVGETMVQQEPQLGEYVGQLLENYVEQLLEDYIDHLKEAGNIGAGNAATALSILLNKKVNMTVADLNIREISELGNMLGEEESHVVAMMIEVYGDINAMLILSLESDNAHKLVEMILGEKTTREDFTALESSVLCETGNILAGTYFNAISSLTGLDIMISVPQMAIDMAGAISSMLATGFSMENDDMMLIQTQFVDQETLLNATYLLALDTCSFEKIVKAMDNIV